MECGDELGALHGGGCASAMTWMDYFNASAGIASILGLGFTIKVERDTRHIRNHFMRRARLPAIHKELDIYRSEISQLFPNEDKNLKLIQEKLVRATATLRAFKPIGDKAINAQIEAFEKEVSDFCRTNPQDTKGVPWRLYLTLCEIETALKNIRKDDLWRQS
jgi:hypothetical protein